MTTEKEGISALVVEDGNNVSLSRVNLQTGEVTRIATNLRAIGLGAIGGVALESNNQNALVAVGGALIRINLLTGEITPLATMICGLGNGLSGVRVEAGGKTVLLSHNVCGILRARIR